MDNKQLNKPHNTGLLNNKHFRTKLIVIITGILLFYLAIYINSKNGFITSLLGHKTIQMASPADTPGK